MKSLVMLDSILDRLHLHRKGRRIDRGQPIRRLRFETLEDRAMLSFTPMTSYAVGRAPEDIVAADFNDDGWLDLATANWLGSSVSILQGNANGTFEPAENINAGGAPVSIAVGDFNKDEVPDLVVANLGGHKVSVLIGNGDATFQTPVSTDVQGGDPKSLAVGDFNEDGKLDVALGTYSYYWGGPTGTQVQILLGTGDGSFTHGDLHSLPYTFYLSVAVADVNNDLRPDVLVANEASNLVSVLLTNLDGTLSYTMGVNDFSTGNRPLDLTVGDFTGDGIPDLLTAGYNKVSLLPGQGGGTFAAPIVKIVNDAVWTAVAEGDFDRDGKLDVVVTSNESEGVLNTLLGQGDGTFSLMGNHAVDISPKSVVAGDFNGDGWLDVATGSGDFIFEAADSVSVVFNGGDWGPANPQLLLGDFDGDGDIDGRDFLAWQRGESTFPLSSENLSDWQSNFGLSAGPSISIDNVANIEGNGNKTTFFTFTVTLSTASDQIVTMSYRTVDGTAKVADGDYSPKTGTLTFASGELTKTINIEVKGDNKKEADEFFNVELFDLSSNSLFSKYRGVGTILNDD